MGDFARIAAKTPGLKMYLVSKIKLFFNPQWQQPGPSSRTDTDVDR
jgi:hypothetical protein